MQGFETPAIGLKLAGQPIEQFRMSRPAAVVAEVAGRGDDSLAKMVLPDPVDHDPRRQRVVRMS